MKHELHKVLIKITAFEIVSPEDSSHQFVISCVRSLT